MAFQARFRHFHENIQLKRFNENAELREKRDRVLSRLRDSLTMGFDWFNQGSYAMGTGVKPVDGDYDIDIGIELHIDPRTTGPLDAKKAVYDAVRRHTSRVEWRHPCITVYYQEAREAVYHVDLAVMAKDSYSNSLYLAMGRDGASADKRGWQPDDRKGFIQAVDDRFSGQNAEQFRRVIRYLKRWKDNNFSLEGRAAPTGLGFTVAAYRWFQPMLAGGFYTSEYDDLAATAALVNLIRRQFAQKWSSSLNRYIHHLSLPFPHAPQDDIFCRMNDQQMFEFHQQLEELAANLEEARRLESTVPLRRVFGEDFPAD